ncbi:class I SAM-dependent methyltransferase [cf. Phormidesmis sp. LEGE 11477]|uniref:class I SAM-dependent methyltransferase n=1 Tax=cf. Phormidesmis sp. LEGE 11477 TaxID=1828680 RepID=UPI00187F91F9|nr:class I SAM-dependent methyltransferase [cf. Phormidesmis sp. LEGE 11477]MBE9060766.1 class I SAM-dependent methyltransferase [cf. Phormidesmis sp. LEGE 11477]
MSDQESSVVFDEERAASYDTRAAKLAPLRDTLHLLTQLVLFDLPADAHILCVGVGTGLELIYLAQEFPQWRFTAIDPAAAMLDTCRQKAEALGIASRCTWHNGYLDSLPNSELFDAVTCFLVSHFFMQREARQQFFSQIASRLRPQGHLVSADLASDMTTPAYHSTCEVWTRMLEYAGYPQEDVEKFLASHGKGAAVLPPDEVASLISSSGFESPVLFLQTLFIHAWYTRTLKD